MNNNKEVQERFRKMSDQDFSRMMKRPGKLNPEWIEIFRRECVQRKMTDYLTDLDRLERQYAKKGYPDFFKAVDRDLIAENLTLLKSRLPKKSTKNNYQLTFKSLKVKKRYDFTRESMQAELQRIADKMREHLMINRHIKILTVENVSAGKFEMIDGLNCIYINSQMKHHNFYQKVAILAHEMSHFYLMRKHNIVKAAEKENELLTELNAIYVGFGFILLKGYANHVEEYANQRTTTKVGYVQLKTVRDCIVQTANLRKQKPDWIVKQADWQDKPYFYIRLFPLRKLYRKSKKKNAAKNSG